KEWISVASPTVQIENSPKKHILLTFTLKADAPAVVPFDAKALKEQLGTTLPVMKLLLHQPTGANAYYYYQLRRLKMEKIQLTVHVEGVQQLMVFNDEGAVDTKKPFMPFGSSPKAGSSFYVGNAEAFQKSLDSATLKLEWEGLPKNFSRYYQGYELP